MGRAARRSPQAGQPGQALKYRKVKRAVPVGPCHSFWLIIITMVLKAHLGLMVLSAGIPRSFKSGLTYEYHELSQE